ncbi:MAG TPA: hypothetical protein DDZ83_15395 [Nitrospinae bacterium]|nr:hypothetical protein [Nitrospinota bacterium]
MSQIRKKSSQNKWKNAEEPAPKLFSVSQAKKRSSQNRGWSVKDLVENGANGADKEKKATPRADIPAMKSPPAAQVAAHSAPREKSSAIRIGRGSLRPPKPLNN